jgi:hypothetical protein
VSVSGSGLVDEGNDFVAGVAVREPSLREKFKPAELLGFSVILAVFATGVITMVTQGQELVLSAVVFGVAFIVGLVTVAMLTMGIKENQPQLGELLAAELDQPQDSI